jgi:hypothetical protein
MKELSRLVVVHSPKASRGAEYDTRVAPKLQQIATAHGIDLVEIPLDNVRYLSACDLVAKVLRDHDTVLSVGGDGISQVTLQGTFTSGCDVVIGFLPLGNANDFATALNGAVKNPAKILASPTFDFHPLELTINRRIKLYVAAYITLGITTVAVDWLNSATVRSTRQRLSHLSPVAALRPSHLKQLSRDINALKFPVFRRDSLLHHDDSVGFFITSAAKGLLRPKSNNFLVRDDFFFHSDEVRDKSSKNGWFGKSLVGGRWATFGLPGTASDYEKLEFLHPSDMAINVGGDTVLVPNVHVITAERAKRSVKIFAPRKSLQS